MSLIVAGMDVSAQHLDIVISKAEKKSTAKRFGNTPAGHQALIKLIRQRKVQRVCLEATGIYHLDLALALHDSGHVGVMVLNPKAAHNYAKVLLTRHKDDPTDAGVLAHYAQHMPFQSWQRPSQAALHLRACARRLATLSKQLTQAKNQYHALQASQETPAFILQDAELSIQQLREQIESLRAKAAGLAEADPTTQEACQLLCSVKGIAQASALALLGELLLLPEDMTARQWVAMAGLDPRHHQSGSSIHKKARLSKVGNRYLRMALYMPALSASRHDRHVQGFYQHLMDDQGLKPLQAICAVMRKLLHAIHGMLRSGKPFDNTRFYAMPDVA